MRAVFFGTSEFAVPTLRALMASAVEVVAVFTQPDRLAGRGRRLTPPPVKTCALEAGLPVLQPERIRSTDVADFRPDVGVVAAYGQILSRKLLGVPRLGLLNLHPSLLPRWRGAAPIQRALLEGDSETGVCVMRVVPELDAGAVLACRSLPIGSRDTSGALHDKLSVLGAEQMVATLYSLEKGEATEEPQDESLVTYADKLQKEEARLDWRLPASRLDRLIRGLNPWPVAETSWPEITGGPVRIWRAWPVPEGSGVASGEVLGPCESPEGEGIRVAAGEGDLVILEIQPPGKKKMDGGAFARGYPCDPGLVLGEGA
ncbi:MAG: methionyl-tRNA formyltransferase [Nitrospinae bacterium]|nr:methionyl-tRNA formyltransferase [Nitrospinota bacterium]